MIKVSSDADRVLVAKVHEAVQEQVFLFWDRLSPEEQNGLLAQLHAVPLPLVRKLIAQYLQGHLPGQEGPEAKVLTPPQILNPAEEADRGAEARAAGDNAIRQGQLCLLTAAGEAEADPSERPKGMLPIGPVSGKSLFRLHAEKVRALCRRYRAAVPWVIVTSPQSHQATVSHFKDSDFFGLNRPEVIFLVQDELPVVNRRGKLLLSAPGRVATCPNGHGGVLLKLLASEEVFRFLEARDLRHLFYFQVDNPLVRIPDSTFLGYHILRGVEASSKAVHRMDPDEKVGVFCQFNGTLGVVEHREINEADKARRDPAGRLAFCGGNMGVHLFSMDFLRRLREEGVALPYHWVQRKTSYVDRKGGRVAPRSPNSVQFASFIFDVLPLAKTTLVMEARRDEEFSPIKNQNGADSLATAQRDLSRLHARWLDAAGVRLPPSAAEPAPVEISPLYALDAEELKSKLSAPADAASRRAGAGLYLE